MDYESDLRASGDLAALWSRARNYTLVSAIPAVSDKQLATAPAWGGDLPLPPGYEVHLQLPDTITERTRQLAAQLTANAPTPYAKAQAIEQYLRQYEYDLSVPFIRGKVLRAVLSDKPSEPLAHVKQPILSP